MVFTFLLLLGILFGLYTQINLNSYVQVIKFSYKYVSKKKRERTRERERWLLLEQIFDT